MTGQGLMEVGWVGERQVCHCQSSCWPWAARIVEGKLLEILYKKGSFFPENKQNRFLDSLQCKKYVEIEESHFVFPCKIQTLKIIISPILQFEQERGQRVSMTDYEGTGRSVAGSNSNPIQAGHPDWGSPWFPQSYQGEC